MGYRSHRPATAKRGIKSTSHLDNVLPRKSHILHKFISMFLICNQTQGEDFPLGYIRGKNKIQTLVSAQQLH